MPVVEHATGGEQERESRLRHFPLRTELERPELAAPAREVVLEEVGGARMIFGRARPMDSALPVQPVVIDAGEIGGQLAHLLPDLRRMEVGPSGRLPPPEAPLAA